MKTRWLYHLFYSVGRSVKNLHVNEDFNEINETLLADLVYGRYN